MTKKNTLQVPDLSDTITSIAKLAHEHIEIVEGGAMKLNGEFYEKTLPSNLTMETVRNVRDHDSQVMTGTALAFGEKAAELFASNEGVHQASIAIRAGRDRISHSLNREGELVSGYSVFGTGGTGGAYRKVSDYLTTLVASKL